MTEAEIADLKAENARLKTDIESYEQELREVYADLRVAREGFEAAMRSCSFRGYD